MADHELKLSRVIDADPMDVYRCWCEPELMKEWFCPRPWTTPVVETDVRPGGSNYILMRGPQGEEFPNRGVYLEVVPGQRLVITDAYTEAWVPSPKPFMTTILTFEPQGGKTHYTALVRHWNGEDRARHEAMGFGEGWAKATDQMEALLRTMAGKN